MTGTPGCLQWLLKVNIELSLDLKYVTAVLELLEGIGWTQKCVSTQAASSGWQDQARMTCGLFWGPLS